ncbi:carbohydrate ABC transporter membrane protein 2, CUT1 family [Alkalispirochaeta americana]|uniref:Carbohydrate ABC transporter membrane protein 2, CUT1 family n=1 Tax=Alkalispirochaeta americana TaxID=159291 RepID=A0A1N6Q4R7_9SPIO|nr:carbohydrate ABC transporter permease [Alkalispirochaeta americana]SIQ11598.1 carbohydrate ABC transporter membrane protein 2, CUT1 family [Alkalispirochaeta americana]
MTIGGTVRMTRFGKGLIVALMVLFAIYFLVPLYVMLVNSVKPLSEIRAGNMMALPQSFSLEFWGKAWATAQIGVQATGLRPYFMNSVVMVIPSVMFSTVIGALAGFVLSQWPVKHSKLLFGLILFGAFIPFQTVLIPMARILGMLRLSGTTRGLILVHTVYGVAFTTLFFRNSYAGIPHELVQSAQVDGAHFMRIVLSIILPNSVAVFMVSVIWQTTNIWNDFLFGASFGGSRGQPMQVALNNLVSSSTGVLEYNVHFAGAVMAALPTLVIYLVSGRYFVRGLMSGSVKG